GRARRILDRHHRHVSASSVPALPSTDPVRAASTQEALPASEDRDRTPIPVASHARLELSSSGFRLLAPPTRYYVPMALLWSLLIVDPLIILSTVCCASATAFAPPKWQTAIARFWGRSLLFFARVKVDVEGVERIQPDRGYVFASNHLSYMDTPVM